MKDVVGQVRLEFTCICNSLSISQMFMEEVRNTSSLEWKMQPSECARVNSLVLGNAPTSTQHDVKIAAFNIDPLNARDYYHVQNETRHTKHWRALATLDPSVAIPVKPALDACRHILFQFVHRGHISKVRSRQQCSLWGWNEQVFEAVFGPLRDTDNYQPVPTPACSSSTFEGAWGGRGGVYQAQISCQVGDKLRQWCSFEDWPQREGRTHFGCSVLASTTARFILELTAVFRCNPLRVPGRRTEICLLMTKATINSNKEINIQPPANKQQKPVRAGSIVVDTAHQYQVALLALKADLNAN